MNPHHALPPEPACKCEGDYRGAYRFTCGECLRNAKPWHYTSDRGVQYPRAPVDLNPCYQGVTHKQDSR